jgi:hypothetical protein
MSNSLFRLIGAVVALSLAPAAAIAGPLAVSTRMLVEKRAIASDGSVRIDLVEPAKVVPGDSVVVMLDYRNAGVQPIADLALTSPVPPGTAFRALRAGSPAAELSVDGVAYAPLASLRVAVPGGGTRAAATDDVTHVRWRLATPVAPGAKGALAFQAVLK